MATYVVLVNWTDKGIAEAKGTLDRTQTVSQMAADLGGRVVLMLWTIGRYDIVAVFEFPTDEAFTTFALRVAALGTVRTESLRGFTADEMRGILAGLG